MDSKEDSSKEDEVDRLHSRESEKDTNTSQNIINGVAIRKGRTESESQNILPPSPPKFVTLNQLAEAAEAFYNMSLAHEITVDSDFKLEKYEPPEDSLERRIKETMHRAFWDILRSSLEADPPDYQPTLRLLGEVKHSLEDLALSNPNLITLIENTLDIEVARSQLAETGRLSLQSYADQVINLMKRFCAPIRDAEIEDLRLITDPVEIFRNVFIILQKMHMDLANFTIAQMRPFIRQQAVHYEREKFDAFYAAQQKLGIDGLAVTRLWIKGAHEELVRKAQAPDPSTTKADSSVATESISATSAMPSQTSSAAALHPIVENPIPPTPYNILREAYLKLLSWPPNQEWPELMMMDQVRLIEMGAQLDRIIQLTSLVLVLCNYVAANANHLFTASLPLGLQQDNLAQFKQSICRSSLSVIHNGPYRTMDELNRSLTEEILLVTELWYNRLLTGVSDELDSFELAQTIGNDPKSPIASLSPESREKLTSLIEEAVYERHPVSQLMRKRALQFLRDAMSSELPDQIPLPPGFSILLNFDSTKLPQSSSTRNGIIPSQPVVPQEMHSGVDFAPAAPIIKLPDLLNATEKPRRPSQNFEILSLSSLAGRFLSLITHNRHVFGKHYASIIQQLIMPAKTSTGLSTSGAETYSEREPKTESNES